jgi:hypothetical protein
MFNEQVERLYEILTGSRCCRFRSSGSGCSGSMMNRWSICLNIAFVVTEIVYTATDTYGSKYPCAILEFA